MKPLAKSLLVVLPLAILAGGWYLLNANKEQAPESPDTQPLTEAPVTEPGFNPLAKADPLEKADNDQRANTLPEAQPSAPVTELQPDTTPETDVDATTVALEPMSDEEFNQLAVALRNNKNLRLELANEFSSNLDPARAKQLAALLGSYDDPEIVQIASDLTYSGNSEQRVAGLDLLSRLQPHSDNARDVAVDLLSSETEPEFIVATMNVLATPSNDATANQRQLLADNLNNLSYHHDAKVRANSLALMGRWDKNSDATRDSLTRGLSDPDPFVRSRVTYALKNVQNPDDSMINGLLSIAENSDEKKTTRYAALNTLSSMRLTGIAARRYSSAKVIVNQRTVRNEN